MQIDWSLVTTALVPVLSGLFMYFHKQGKKQTDQRFEVIIKQHEDIRESQAKIYQEVQITNGKVKQLETFADMHSDDDNRRFSDIGRSLENLLASVSKVHGRIDTLISQK